MTWPWAKQSCKAIAELLLKSGANANAGETALWLAESNREGVAEVLVRAGTDVNKADANGDTPPSVAANKAIVALLLESGVNKNAVNQFGKSALWRAVTDDVNTGESSQLGGLGLA